MSCAHAERPGPVLQATFSRPLPRSIGPNRAQVNPPCAVRPCGAAREEEKGPRRWAVASVWRVNEDGDGDSDGDPDGEHQYEEAPLSHPSPHGVPSVRQGGANYTDTTKRGKRYTEWCHGLPVLLGWGVGESKSARAAREVLLYPPRPFLTDERANLNASLSGNARALGRVLGRYHAEGSLELGQGRCSVRVSCLHKRTS
jgi:hypothetical protein